MIQIKSSNLKYLKDLAKNNNREWFNENKDRYEVELEHMRAFADELLYEMNQNDDIETLNGKKCLQRIYRDVRFSKDKSPYKRHWGGGMRRATKWRRGGYYFHIEPGHTFVGGGFWGPNKDDLAHIRSQIAQDHLELQGIVKDPKFVEYFGELKGDKLKTAPRDYPKDHPGIELLKHKGFLCIRHFDDKEVTSPEFINKMVETFQAMRPFLNYMSDILTTDLNGEVL